MVRRLALDHPGSQAACWASEPNSAMASEATSVGSSGTGATDRPWLEQQARLEVAEAAAAHRVGQGDAEQPGLASSLRGRGGTSRLGLDSQPLGAHMSVKICVAIDDRAL
jgi:hypothetical protein